MVEIQEIVGYRFLFSIGIADVLLLVNYSVWPAITILAKSELVTKEMRPWIQARHFNDMLFLHEKWKFKQQDNV